MTRRDDMLPEDTQACLEALQVLPAELRAKYRAGLEKAAWEFDGDGSGEFCTCSDPRLPCPPPVELYCTVCKKPYVLKKRPEHQRWLKSQGRTY